MWLDFIFSYQVQPTLKKYPLCMVYGYPAVQASLARLNTDNPAIADRFEVFVRGVEIGNGFFELWLPRNRKIMLGVKGLNRTALGAIETYYNSMPTVQLKREEGHSKF